MARVYSRSSVRLELESVVDRCACTPPDVEVCGSGGGDKEAAAARARATAPTCAAGIGIDAFSDAGSGMTGRREAEEAEDGRREEEEDEEAEEEEAEGVAAPAAADAVAVGVAEELGALGRRERLLGVSRGVGMAGDMAGVSRCVLVAEALPEAAPVLCFLAGRAPGAIIGLAYDARNCRSARAGVACAARFSSRCAAADRGVLLPPAAPLRPAAGESMGVVPAAPTGVCVPVRLRLSEAESATAPAAAGDLVVSFMASSSREGVAATRNTALLPVSRSTGALASAFTSSAVRWTGVPTISPHVIRGDASPAPPGAGEGVRISL